MRKTIEVISYLDIDIHPDNFYFCSLICPYIYLGEKLTHCILFDEQLELIDCKFERCDQCKMCREYEG